MSLIQGVGLSGFRSFSADRMTYIDDFDKINLIVGQNNAGKSNVLRWLQRSDPSHGFGDFSSLDSNSGNPINEEGWEIAFGWTRKSMNTWLMEIVQEDDLWSEDENALNRMFDLLSVGEAPGLAWLRFSLTEEGAGKSISMRWFEELVRTADAELFQAMESLDTRTGGAGNGFAPKLPFPGVERAHQPLHRVLSRFAEHNPLPPVRTVGAFRQIRQIESLAAAREHDGNGLIEQLDNLRGPDAENYEDRKKFDAIQGFVRSVLDDPSLTMEIPSSRKSINIVQRDAIRPLPLENMGTGIHQVVILAAAATLMENTVVCMEEPEIHLHPILQRKLLHYLAKNTSNQYMIATHSAHFLDSKLAAIYHISIRDGISSLRRAASPQDLADVCADLGYRASDLMQSNAIIWVEGPSDRIYLQFWVARIAPDLVEGVHYSIMFYGGRLLNHLSADDPDVDDFISLKRLNRNMAIIMDSDRESIGDDVNATKRRVENEVGSDHGVSWTTAGYTIENYVPVTVLKRALEAVHASASIEDFRQFENPFSKSRVSGISYIDKVAVAREVCERTDVESVWQFDFHARIEGLVEFIRSANR